MAFSLLWWRRRRHERVAFVMYGQAVVAARDPAYYATLGVPDTLDGRFDLVGVHVFLLIRHLRCLNPPGPEMAQRVFDAMFGDMDVNLREMGVGDLSVGKRVKAMWEAFHGRAMVYDAAIVDDDRVALAAALARNVWRGEPPPPGSPERLAGAVMAQAAHIAALDFFQPVAVDEVFLPAAQVLAS